MYARPKQGVSSSPATSTSGSHRSKRKQTEGEAYLAEVDISCYADQRAQFGHSGLSGGCGNGLQVIPASERSKVFKFVLSPGEQKQNLARDATW